MRSTGPGYAASMNRVTTRHLAAVLCAVLALAGCTSATNDQPSEQTTTTTTETTATPSPGNECADVADKARALLTEVGQLTTGGATDGDVRAAASELSDSFDAAKATLGPDVAAQLDQAEQALQQVQDALGAQPVDTAALRRAASDLVADLGDAATVCSPDSSTTSTSSTAPTS